MGYVEVHEAGKVKVWHGAEGGVGHAQVHEGVLQPIEGVALEVLWRRNVEQVNRVVYCKE